MTHLPNVLIVGRIAWDTNHSTLSSIFENYPAEKLAYICIETKEPDYSRCVNHYQISEIALIKRIFKWKTETGHNRIPTEITREEKSLEKSESSTIGWVRRHRSHFFLYIRELLWRFGGWKTKGLEAFINEFAPDVLFFVGDPLPLMNRLQLYILQLTKLPAAMFMMDDIWSYQSDPSFLRYLLRREVKRLIPSCKAHFAICPKMKEECDTLYGTDCVLLTKGIEGVKESLVSVHTPISLVYTGNLNYGRLFSLIAISKTIALINKSTPNRAFLHIYTQATLNEKEQEILNQPGVSQIHPAVPYKDLPRIYDASDIVLFVESLEKKYKYVARLSFSTKLTDYLGCGRCIFAVGAEDIAPIEYLRNAGIAVTCGNTDDIKEKLEELLSHPDMITRMAGKSLDYGKTHHDAGLMQERLYTTLDNIRKRA